MVLLQPIWLEKDHVSLTRISMSRWRVEILSNALQIQTTDSRMLTTISLMVHLETTWNKMELTACSNKYSKQMVSRCRPRTLVHWREIAANKDKSLDNNRRVTKTYMTLIRLVRQWVYHNLATTSMMLWEVVREEATQAHHMVQLPHITLIIKVF
jgi:hypothetical protein